MREVEFQESGMENFGPYIEPMELSFPNDQLTLLTGPNGIGKTMALDSIPFTLYGITSKKAKGDDVVNNKVGRNCKTWVKFKVNNDQYIVTRYHKYTKLYNTVIINKNGEDIKKGQREALPEIEKLICSQKAFMNTLMFGQKVKDFFTDLVDSDKKEIFRKILGLERYILYYKQADKVLKEIKELKNNLVNQIEINKGLYEDAINQIKILSDLKIKFYEQQDEAIKNLAKLIEDNKRLLNSWQKTLNDCALKRDGIIEETIKELAKIQNELSIFEKNTSAEIEKLDKQKEVKILELNEEVNKNKTLITSKIGTESKVLHDKQSELKLTLNDISLDKQNKGHQIELQINELKFNQENCSREITAIESNALDDDISICPTCEQDVTEVKGKLITKVENFKIEIEENQREIDNLKSKKSTIINDLQKQEKKVVNEIAEINLQLVQLTDDEERQKYEIDQKLKGLINKVDSLVTDQEKKILNNQAEEQKQLEEKEIFLKNKKENQEKINQEIEKIERTVTSLEQEINTFTFQLEQEKNAEYDETQLNSYITKQYNLQTSIENKNQEIVQLEKQITIHEFWKSGFSSTGIPSMLIDDSIPFMNEKITKYLDLLTNGRYIVSFDTLDETKAGDFRDKISVHVIDTHTQANSRVQLSGGQTRIIDIATILTLGDLQANIQDVKFNILLFDEIFDALDYDNATYVSKVLNKLKIGKSIYVISHQHQDQLESDETLEFK